MRKSSKFETNEDGYKFECINSIFHYPNFWILLILICYVLKFFVQYIDTSKEEQNASKRKENDIFKIRFKKSIYFIFKRRELGVWDFDCQIICAEWNFRNNFFKVLKNVLFLLFRNVILFAVVDMIEKFLELNFEFSVREDLLYINQLSSLFLLTLSLLRWNLTIWGCW